MPRINPSRNSIQLGDCVKLLRRLKDDCIDLTVTSPPYDQIRTYNGFVFDFEAIATELYRVTKPGGVVVWIVGDQVIKGSESGTSFRQALYFKELGFNIHDTMIYQKPGFMFPESTRYNQIFEYMFVLSKGKPKTVNLIKDKPNKPGTNNGKQRDKNGDMRLREGVGKDYPQFGIRFNVWRINQSVTEGNKEKLEHPATFPTRLAMDHIHTWSNEGDLVLDPMIGSGTTAIAAVLKGRDYLGFDISEKYVKLAKRLVKRMEDKIQAKLKEMEGV